MNNLPGDTAEGRQIDLEAGASSSFASDIPVAPGQGTVRLSVVVVQEVTSSDDDIQNRLLMVETLSRNFRRVIDAIIMNAVKKIMVQDLAGIHKTTREVLEVLEALEGPAQEAVAEIQDRRAAFQDFETGLRDLHEVFLMLGIPLGPQGEPVGNIVPEGDTEMHPKVDPEMDLEVNLRSDPEEDAQVDAQVDPDVDCLLNSKIVCILVFFFSVLALVANLGEWLLDILRSSNETSVLCLGHTS